MSKKLTSLSFVNDIKKIIEESKKYVYKNVNTVMIRTYWMIGERIINEEQNGKNRAKYNSRLLIKLSGVLTRNYGKGFSRQNLQNMRLFYLSFKKSQTLSGKLSWSHYCLLSNISDEKSRMFYFHECENSNWSVRELQRQIDSCLYQRLINASENREKKIIELSKKGINQYNPEDFIKDPVVLEFLEVDSKIEIESDLEKSIVNHIEDFLLELGKGFMFVGTQQRVVVSGIVYYVDMVFYNKILKSYVLIDLKMNKLKPENYGQMNMYINYYKNNINDEGDNDPIGLILCAEKEEELAKISSQGILNKR